MTIFTFVPKGKCEKASQDLVERFWTFITTLDSDIVAQFMKDNLAGTVVVFSLIIWIPASCYVNRLVRNAGARLFVMIGTNTKPRASSFIFTLHTHGRWCEVVQTPPFLINPDSPPPSLPPAFKLPPINPQAYSEILYTAFESPPSHWKTLS